MNQLELCVRAVIQPPLSLSVVTTVVYLNVLPTAGLMLLARLAQLALALLL